MKRWILLGSCVLAALAAGCGVAPDRPSGEFSGSVTLDGKPLEQGSVHFTSSRSGETTYANLEPGGTYLVSFPKMDVGQEYQVAIDKPVVEELDAHALETNPPSRATVKIPPKYTNRTTSGLTVTAGDGGKVNFDIALKSS